MSLYRDGLTLGEGPRWNDGALWVSDPQKGGIWTDSGGTWDFMPLAAQSNGLWFLPDGRLAGAIMREKRVGLWDGAGFGAYADLSAVAEGPLGDMVGDRHGGLYVDDVGYAAHLGEQPRPGRLIHVAPGGRAATVAAEDVEFPNGLAIIDDGHTLVVAETWAQRLTAFTIGAGGQLTDRRLFADLAAVVHPEARPDGICAAADGVWVCTLTGHAVVRVARSGPLVQISTGDGHPVACCLDPNGRLFVTVAETGGVSVLEAVANKTLKSRVDIYEPAATP